MGRDLVIGDIHGAHKALEQCLERCGFDYKKDRLKTVGDICDGWAYVYECVEILLKIENRIDIIGNHDEWFHRWLKTGIHPDNWRQGGMGTVRSYMRHCGNGKESIVEVWDRNEDSEPVMKLTDFNINCIPEKHIDFFNNQHWYYKDGKKRLFVHGGFLKGKTLIENQRRPHDEFYFHWNRELWDQALSVQKGEKLTFKEEFSEIFIGHTATIHWTQFKKKPNSLVLMPTQDTDCPPMKADIIYNLDTGAGSSGKLTIMDVDTKEYWQSDCVKDFYGEYKPR